MEGVGVLVADERRGYLPTVGLECKRDKPMEGGLDCELLSWQPEICIRVSDVQC